MLDSHAHTDRIAEILEAHRGLEGPLLPILHAIQEAFGYVPEAAVPQIAAALTLSKAEVHGVISFYHDFRSAPAGRRQISWHDLSTIPLCLLTRTCRTGGSSTSIWARPGWMRCR